MTTDLPRIDAVSVPAPMTLRVRWKGPSETVDIDLTDWIATGGSLLEALLDPEVFAKAAVCRYGAAISWNGDESDLSIDATHLARVAVEQKRAP